ncbi:MAG: hypothetical protein R2941_24345 [Desulfobacterales bacterium]
MRIREIADGLANPEFFLNQAEAAGIGYDEEISDYGYCEFCDEYYFNSDSCPCGRTESQEE